MTEKKKKWIVDEDDELRLFYGDEEFNGSAYPCNDIVFMKMIADRLNELEKENEQLKDALNQRTDQCDKYYKENEQLQSDNNRLVNETAKIIAEHQRKVFDLIDEKIKEADEYFKQSYDSWYQGKFDVLTELKKELQE